MSYTQHSFQQIKGATSKNVLDVGYATVIADGIHLVIGIDEIAYVYSGRKWITFMETMLGMSVICDEFFTEDFDRITSVTEIRVKNWPMNNLLIYKIVHVAVVLCFF